MLGAGHDLIAVFFREEGVYNCVPGTAGETGMRDLAAAWAGLNERHGVDLMVCQSSAVRRLSGPCKNPFREAGLVELMDRVAECDRVVTL